MALAKYNEKVLKKLYIIEAIKADIYKEKDKDRASKDKTSKDS